MPIAIRIDKENNSIVIVLPMEKPRLSASGKTTLIATSHGLASGEASYSGRPVMVAASAFVYPEPLQEKENQKSGKLQRTPLDSEAGQSIKVRARKSKTKQVRPAKRARE